jgi:DNA-binding GntR family transcriptional regulator
VFVKKMADLPSLEHFNNKSLRERILDTLRSAILSGELKPGQTLVETELALQLGVSRAPLREAIQILNSEGFVATVPYHGTTVKKLTKTDIEELYSFRSVLESFAIQRILEQASPNAVNELRSIYDRMIEAANNNSWRDVNMTDREFHDKIIELSGHTLLSSTWNTVHMRVQQVMSLHNLRNRNIVQVAQNHLPIISAIEANDLQLATQVIQEHIATTGDLIAEGWHVNEDEA